MADDQHRHNDLPPGVVELSWRITDDNKVAVIPDEILTAIFARMPYQLDPDGTIVVTLDDVIHGLREGVELTEDFQRRVLAAHKAIGGHGGMN